MPAENKVESPFSRNRFLNIWYENLAGMQLRTDNASEVSRWVGPNASVVKQDGDSLVRIVTNRGDLMVNIGDFVTVDSDRRFKILRIQEVEPGTTAMNLFPQSPKPNKASYEVHPSDSIRAMAPKPGNHLKK